MEGNERERQREREKVPRASMRSVEERVCLYSSCACSHRLRAYLCCLRLTQGLVLIAKLLDEIIDELGKSINLGLGPNALGRSLEEGNVLLAQDLGFGLREDKLSILLETGATAAE